jgi:hypothetical protein
MGVSITGANNNYKNNNNNNSHHKAIPETGRGGL